MTRNLMRKDKTVILLIDFLGHPILGDEYVNNKRYSELLNFLQTEPEQRKDIIFVSNVKVGEKGSSEKLNEIFEMANNLGFNTLQIYGQGIDAVHIIDKIYKVAGWKISPSDTQIILGGCNLGGCITDQTNYGAVFWSELGFKTIIHLPLCAEYEQPGVSQVEKICNGFSRLYNTIQNKKAFNIKITNNIKDIRDYR
tara:strand:+ start:29 stop:619 length:591 start_codon:yes stop_codon:yes gene_type:complete